MEEKLQVKKEVKVEEKEESEDEMATKDDGRKASF